MEYLFVSGLFILLLLILIMYSNRKLNNVVRREIRNECAIFKNKVLYKVENDIKNENIDKAISRLYGALECQPLENEILSKLTQLLLEKDEYVKAGKLLVLKENKSQKEELAVNRFKQSVGNDPVLILRKIITVNFFKFRELSQIQLELLSELIENVYRNGNSFPKFLLDLERYLQKKNI